MTKRKKLVVRNSRKRKFYFSLLLVCLLMLGVGFSNIATHLNISGNVNVYKYDKTLYGVLERAAQNGIYAREYTGEHQDSMDASLSTQKIYHWYATNDTDGTAIQNKNNVVFAGFCWKMIRTTDTGGVKLLYKGIYNNGNCSSNGGPGYENAVRNASITISGEAYFGSEYTYSPSSQKFKLAGDIISSTFSTSYDPALEGMYTCKSTDKDAECSSLYLVTSNTWTKRVTSSNNGLSSAGYSPIYNTSNYLYLVGYQFGDQYKFDNWSGVVNTVFSTGSLTTTYWYADSITYDSTEKEYSLVNPYQVSATSDYPNLEGKYTFMNTTSTYTNNQVYHIDKVNNSAMYYTILSNGETMADYNDTYTYGNSYTDNGNGTYTINSPIGTINRADYYSSYNQISQKYVCKNAVNNTCTDIHYAMFAYNYKSIGWSSTSVYKFGNSFTYDNNTHQYTLTDTVNVWDLANSTTQTSLNTRHYTCWNDSGVCNKLYYVYFIEGNSRASYIELKNGEDIDVALDNMMGGKTEESLAKKLIDPWYKNNLLKYDSYIEDTIFCNDRSYNSNNGWNPDGGSITTTSSFRNYNVITDLTCPNVTDRLSVSNPDALLTYKVSLISAPEMNLLNNNKLRSMYNTYWTLSPYLYIDAYTEYAGGRYFKSTGELFNSELHNQYDIRPSISLVPGISYTSGKGTVSNPYIIDLAPVEEEGNHLMLNDYVATKVFGKELSRSSFESITTLDSKQVSNNAIDSWDVSEKQNGSIMAWYTDSDNNGKYELYLGQDGGVVANPNSRFLFARFSALNSIDLSHLDVSHVVNMKGMFFSLQIPNLDLGSNFDTSNVTDMSYMFYGTSSNSSTFALNLGSKFDTSKVTDMHHMFYRTGYSSTNFALNLGSNFDTSHVTNMSNMFNQTGRSSSSFTLNLGSNFDTFSVVNMSYMFYETGYSSQSFTLDLGSHFDTSHVTNMSYMFYSVGFNSPVFTLNLGNLFNTLRVEQMSYMFYQTGYNNTSFTLSLGNHFDTSAVTYMNDMFYRTGYSSTSFTLNLGNLFDTSNVSGMVSMFHGTGYSSPVFTLNLGNHFNTSSVTRMDSMFYQTGYSSQNFTLDLGSQFNTSNVTVMDSMFYQTGYSNPSFTMNLGNQFDTSKVTDMDKMFDNTGYMNANLVLNLDDFKFSGVTSYTNIFNGARSTMTVYARNTKEKNWIIARHNNLTNTNVLTR